MPAPTALLKRPEELAEAANISLPAQGIISPRFWHKLLLISNRSR